MFLASFPAGPWQANCYLLAGPGSHEVVLIDPGVEAAATVEQVVTEHNLTVVAVVGTHGHIDHIASAAPLADRYQVPLWLHPADRQLLTDPAAGLGEAAIPLLTELGLARLSEPGLLEEFHDGQAVRLAGLDFEIVHVPGHTAGSVLLRLAVPSGEPVDEIVFTGDTVFAGSIGRTDLPGGDPQAMRRSLAERVLPLPDAAALLPGHGPQTLMATERTTNPYLIQRGV